MRLLGISLHSSKLPLLLHAAAGCPGLCSWQDMAMVLGAWSLTQADFMQGRASQERGHFGSFASTDG